MNSGSLTRLYNFSSQILDHFGSIADPSGCTVYFQGLYLSGSVYLISDHFDPYLALFFTFTFLWSNLLCLYSTLAAAILQSWIHFCVICSIFTAFAELEIQFLTICYLFMLYLHAQIWSISLHFVRKMFHFRILRPPSTFAHLN